jgi:CheY-like chemotaxis protein
MLFATGIRGRALEELTILVIEDDPDVQMLIDEALCDGGYEPALASSGEEPSHFCVAGKQNTGHS